ncbi:hypothetical protein HY485_02385 [Candidatus Woesearchaeota archaeon]|nr:hypothetical protein [Candidatus Woesearchaeota archaeon]
MQNRALIFFVVLLLFVSFVFAAKERLEGASAAFHQPNIGDVLERPFQSAGNGFTLRNSLLGVFPTRNDARVRNIDASKVGFVRQLLEDTVQKKFYTPPDFKTLSCAGGRIFDMDRSMMQPLAELACLEDVQVPLLRTTGLRSTNFVTGKTFWQWLPSSMTGMASLLVTGRVAARADAGGECNELLQPVAHKTFDGVLASLRDLVASELDISTCSGLPRARLSFARGNTHTRAHRFASAINFYEEAWRTAVSCACQPV